MIKVTTTYTYDRSEKKKSVKIMANIHAFKGNLLHPIFILNNLPKAGLPDDSIEEGTIELEIFPLSCLSMCQQHLPILKSVKSYFRIKDFEDFFIDTEGDLNLRADLWNIPDQNLPDIEGGETYIEHLGRCGFSIGDVVSGVSIGMERAETINQKNYGENGIVARPEMSFQYRIDNDMGLQLDANTIELIFEATVDWVPITESEWQAYLQELWMIQALQFAGD